MNRVKQLVHAENVYRMGYTGKNIRVVTLDTGVYLHPDLRQNVVGFLDFVAMKRACYDDNGHGTHVGGILCANGRMKGMAPQAQLIALKVLGKDGGGQTERVIRGLQWVLAHHKELGIRILNFSVGFLPGALDREQKQIMELLEQLWDDGVTVVTAAGNNGPEFSGGKAWWLQWQWSDRMLYYEAGNFSTGDEYCKSGSSRSTIFQKKWYLYGNPCRMRGTGTCITEKSKAAAGGTETEII